MQTREALLDEGMHLKPNIYPRLHFPSLYFRHHRGRSPRHPLVQTL